MMRPLFLLGSACMLAACSGSEHTVPAASAPVQAADSAHTGAVRPQWSGVYQGRMPCAACDHVATILTLNPDQSYRFFAEAKGGKDNFTETSEGRFEWEQPETILKLDDNGHGARFLIHDKGLQQLTLEESAYSPDSLYQLQKTQ